jgi:asparagine synthase (glutamine-hydrolysing)
VPLNTFTIGFNEKSYDESYFARIVANKYNPNHHEEILTEKSCVNLIPHVLEMLDEPICDPSIIPTYLVNSFASAKVKVLLTGDGGDELFAGYETFKALTNAKRYHSLVPQLFHKIITGVVQKLPSNPRNMSFDYKLRKVLNGFHYAPEYWNAAWLSPLQKTQHIKMFDCEIKNPYQEMLEIWEGDKDLESNTLLYYSKMYLPHNLMFKADRSSMLNGVEGRAIFLDNDLVDFSLKLPFDMKYKRGITKYLLRKVAEKNLPKKITDRPKKGFGITVQSWLKNMPREWFDIKCPGLNNTYILQMYDEHKKGKADHRLVLWSALSLGFCLRKYEKI